MFQCKNCGGILVYDPGSGKMLCKSCRSEFTVAETESDDYSEEDDTFGSIIFTCPSCGGELTGIDGSIAASFCPYCGQPVTMRQRMERLKAPKYIIPFKVTKEECIESYKENMNHWYVPSKFKGSVVTDSIKGIYMPYALYSEGFAGPFCMKDILYFSVGNVTHYSEMRYDGEMNGDVSNIPFDASVEFDDAVSTGILPFDLTEAVRFKPQYLAGFYADTGNADLAKYEETAAEIAAEQAEIAVTGKIKDDIPDKYNSESFDVIKFPEPHKLETEIALLPTWFMTVKTRDKRVAYAVGNGETGSIFTDMPVSIGKYCLVSVLMGIAIFIISTFALTMSMSVNAMTAAVMVLTSVSSIITNLFLGLSLKRVKPFDLGEDGAALEFDKIKRRYRMRLTVAGLIVLGYLTSAMVNVLASDDTNLSFSSLITAVFSLVLVVSVIVNLVYSYKIRINGGTSGMSYLFSTLAAVFGLELMVNGSVNDLPHFLLASAALVFVVISFIAAVQENNRRVFQIPPQFKTHKGGSVNGQ